MPFYKRQGKEKQYFYEYRRDRDGMITKHYIGRKNSLEVSIASSREREHNLQKEKLNSDKKLLYLLGEKLAEYKSKSRLLVRSSLLQKGFYMRGSEVRKISRREQ